MQNWIGKLIDRFIGTLGSFSQTRYLHGQINCLRMFYSTSNTYYYPKASLESMPFSKKGTRLQATKILL